MAFDDIRLEKGLYSGAGLTANLEKADPSENYRGTRLEKTDAFQRQLRRFGIKTSGRDSDRVENSSRPRTAASCSPNTSPARSSAASATARRSTAYSPRR